MKKAIGIVFLVLAMVGCRSAPLPEPGSQAYLDAVVSFYTGLAALQSGDFARAQDRLAEVTRRVPGEPAGWANLGLLSLLQKDLDRAEEYLERARDLAPGNSAILVMLGRLESARGNLVASMAYFRQAIQQDPRDIRAMYALVQEAERQGTVEGLIEAQRVLEQARRIQPDNLLILLEMTRIAARRNDFETVRTAILLLERQSPLWPEEAGEAFRDLREAAAGRDSRRMATQVTFLRQTLEPLTVYQEDAGAISRPEGEPGDPLAYFVRLPSPAPTPAPPDTGMTFARETFPNTGSQVWPVVSAEYLTAGGTPAIVLAGPREVRVGRAVPLPFPGDPGATTLTRNSVLAVDLDNDWLQDVVLAGNRGLRLYRQTGDSLLIDESFRLPTAVARAACTGAWPIDVEMDGDLDLVIGTSNGSVPVLRNNGDGSFTMTEPFTGAGMVQEVSWADLDGDGTPDAVLLDAAGRMYLFTNERGGRFRSRPLLEDQSPAAAVTVADIDHDGAMDVLVLRAGGTLQRLSWRDDNRSLSWASMGQWPGVAESLSADQTHLVVADLDNNGGLDVIAAMRSRSHVWISNEAGRLVSLMNLDLQIFTAVDLSGDGRLDLVGRSESGEAVRLINQGTLDYRSQIVRPRAARAEGDRRINSFGLGGEIEIRSGLLYQKQLISGPVVHFGVGGHPVVEIVRIVWPNGTVQAEYNLAPDHPLLTEQRLKGSCPFVFTWNGKEMTFVTDFLWRSPLGLAINAQQTAGVVQTEDWIKIRRDQLVEKEGYYDIRITADLWETHFFDHVALQVVDHPAESAVHVDERFVIPHPPARIHATSIPRPVARVWDDRGHDVTELVKEVDQTYLDFFGRGLYQGITRPHFIEIELADPGTARGGLVLIGYGWVRPTDSSINVAIGQGRHPKPEGLQLEVQDRTGAWVKVRSDLGFPAGKTKTVMIELEGLFEEKIPRRIRLRTNLEIYWDALKWAIRQPEAGLRIQSIDLEYAELRYRGFNEMVEANRSSPEIPRYRLAGTTQRWRDLTGYYTRFGNVLELLERTDDRYVIANAGDELAMRFPAPPPPPEGWVRDFVLIGTGWNKDGDYNTAYSRTVLPLPSGRKPDYDTPPGRLQDDPVYRLHQDDWRHYHTRYVTPDRFRKTLRSVH